MIDFLFQSLKPFQNPIGFGSSDFVELGIAVFLLTAILVRDRIRVRVPRPWLAAMVLAALPVLLRLALLPTHPVPPPRTAVEIDNVLAADTLLHGRLTNPSHPMARFFGPLTPLGPMWPGVLLAIGRAVFGHEWAGVLLGMAAFVVAGYWMMLAVLPAEWAFGGSLFAALMFGPLHAFGNAYTSSSLRAVAACLIVGSALRLFRVRRLHPPDCTIVIAVVAMHFVFWYGVHVFEPRPGPMALRVFESRSGLTHSPDRRGAVLAELNSRSGQHLVLVPPRTAVEWLRNEADLDRAQVVWARYLGPQETARLLAYFTDRKAWTLDFAVAQPKVVPYEPPPPPTPPSVVEPSKPTTKPKYKLQFEEVK